MKKTAVIVLLIILAAALSGCAEVCYSITIDSYGGRVVAYTVTFDGTADDFERDLSVVKSLFEYTALSNTRATVGTTENSVSLSITYETLTDYYIAMGITGDEPGEDSEFIAVNAFFREYVVELSPARAADFAYYALKFLLAAESDFETAFRANYVALVQAEDGLPANLPQSLSDTLKGLCFGFDMQSYMELLRGEYASEVAPLTNTVLLNCGYDYSQVNAFFEYSHGYKSVYPKQYDSKFDRDGNTVYKWQLNSGADNTFTLYQKAPNVWAWELLGIGLAAFALVFLVIVLIVKKKLNTRLD